ncbi:pyridoxal-phosphate dependent enzyme [Streptomyces sp. QH1-20]|uniref:pyridoxal-phosphate dependent enzyme n=1 Tax=Streptomyces sp. QH1-20 TaxID=3240934 RepID=UPI003510DCBB
MEIYREDKSVVLRYAEHLQGLSPAGLHQVSMREGARILRLSPYRQVGIDVLDLSTLSTTGTFKDWVACVAVARTRAAGRHVIAAQSSGNTANALAAYAARAGLRAVILYPPQSRRRIHAVPARHPGIDLVEVDACEKHIKDILQDAARAADVPALPTLHDQYEGNKLRAYFLRDAVGRSGQGWDWHAQALSSAYGPLGFYRGLAETCSASPARAKVPRFLGVQQESVAPYARALSGAGPPEEDVVMLEPTLFRRSVPADLIDRVRQMCVASNGTVRCLPNARYLQWEPRAVAMMGEAGAEITLSVDGRPQERAGLYSLAGVLEAIEDGTISPGERALAVFTGGSGPVAATFLPDHRVTAADARSYVTQLLAAPTTRP